MATNLALDDELILEAQKLGGHKTKKAAVMQALAEYVAYQKRVKILALAGSIDFDSDYNHKRERHRR
jgi:Arc/MetJ family transcription regulator